MLAEKDELCVACLTDEYGDDASYPCSFGGSVGHICKMTTSGMAMHRFYYLSGGFDIYNEPRLDAFNKILNEVCLFNHVLFLLLFVHCDQLLQVLSGPNVSKTDAMYWMKQAKDPSNVISEVWPAILQYMEETYPEPLNK